MWNALPERVVGARTLITFKKYLDDYLNWQDIESQGSRTDNWISFGRNLKWSSYKVNHRTVTLRIKICCDFQN